MECRQKRENKLGLALAHYEKLASDKPSLVQQLKALLIHQYHAHCVASQCNFTWTIYKMPKYSNDLQTQQSQIAVNCAFCRKMRSGVKTEEGISCFGTFYHQVLVCVCSSYNPSLVLL